MTRGDWNQVWSSFDERKKTRANDEEEAGDDGDDMFEKAGIAAE